MNAREILSITVLSVALVMRLVSESTADASYLVIAVYALMGRMQAIQALAFSWLFSMLSPGIAPLAPSASVGRYAVVFGVVLSVVIRSWTGSGGIRMRPATRGTLLLGLFFVVHSLLFSPIVDVSVLKAVSWVLVMSAMIEAWTGLEPENQEKVSRQIFGGLVVLLIASSPLLLMPLGYLRNNTGFQGVMSHPQSFGPTMALLGAWAVSYIFSAKRPPWSLVWLAMACVVLVVLSEARTAGLALLLGVGVAIVTAPMFVSRQLTVVFPGLRSPRTHIVFFIALAGLIVAGAKVENVITHYLTKSGRSEGVGLVEQYQTSRGRLMDQMWINIQENPLQGIGFGIDSYPLEMDIKRESLFGLPVSASVEKGVMPLAVLEELGLVGFLAFAMWVYMLLRHSVRGGVAPFLVVMTILFLNFGESTLFSPGGVGLLSLILLGWAFSSGHRRRRPR